MGGKVGATWGEVKKEENMEEKLVGGQDQKIQIRFDRQIKRT